MSDKEVLVPIEEPKWPEVPDEPWKTIKECNTETEIVDELLRISELVPFWYHYDSWRSACLQVLANKAMQLRSGDGNQ